MWFGRNRWHEIALNEKTCLRTWMRTRTTIPKLLGGSALHEWPVSWNWGAVLPTWVCQLQSTLCLPLFRCRTPTFSCHLHELKPESIEKWIAFIYEKLIIVQYYFLYYTFSSVVPVHFITELLITCYNCDVCFQRKQRNYYNLPSSFFGGLTLAFFLIWDVQNLLPLYYHCARFVVCHCHHRPHWP